ncbi:hypothetical protein B0H11DRAFT_579765 [Mycena galericulata]|nr:hypothetical protein B0H11DRAFT_579765 [Mycena galericulata]
MQNSFIKGRSCIPHRRARRMNGPRRRPCNARSLISSRYRCCFCTADPALGIALRPSTSLSLTTDAFTCGGESIRNSYLALASRSAGNRECLLTSVMDHLRSSRPPPARWSPGEFLRISVNACYSHRTHRLVVAPVFERRHCQEALRVGQGWGIGGGASIIENLGSRLIWGGRLASRGRLDDGLSPLSRRRHVFASFLGPSLTSHS